MEIKTNFNGPLDVAARCLEENVVPISRLYTEGTRRMKPEEIEHLDKYLKRCRVAIGSMGKTLSAFKALNRK